MICHRNAGKGAAPTKLRFEEIAPMLGEKLIADFIAGGDVRLRKPAFRKTPSPEQINDVVVYIRTIQKNSEAHEGPSRFH